MEFFLESVARAYSDRYEDLSDFCFVFPNKRAGTFFIKYLQSVSEQERIAPEVTSIDAFMEQMSGRLVAPGLDLIFRLYKIYTTLLLERGMEQKELPSFEDFRGWGETVLSDFSEVDRYCADPEEVFKNVRDYRSISSNFLTEEQKLVIEEYFGRIPETEGVEGFWKNFDGAESDMSEIKSKFLYLWEIMAPLKQRLDSSLADEGLSTQGFAYRLAAERLREGDLSGLRWQKVVMVGFNALSTSEASLFSQLRKQPPRIEGEDESYCDFIWDGTGPVLNDTVNTASTFLEMNRRAFPQPVWAVPYISRSDRKTLPEKMEVIASPTRSAQAQIVGEKVKELMGEIPQGAFADARVAVVLPDESLLLPVLYSMPEKMKDVNLTMGYPLKLTSTVSFVNHLRRLQTRHARTPGGEVGYYVRDLRLFMGHPFVHIVAGSGVLARLNAHISRSHLSVIPVSEVEKFSAQLAWLLRPMGHDMPGVEVMDRIDSILKYVSDRLPEGEGSVVKSRLDSTHIAVYRDALMILRHAVVRHGVNLMFLSVFKLVDRLISPVRVSFEGEPLQGLQVMGLLETRALDFDHLIVASVNEGKLPAKMRKPTFIPNSLRSAYGLPPANYQESIFSYYFYRMISRASDVTFIYDSRAGAGLGSNEMSRYLRQLHHLYVPGGLKTVSRRFMMAKTGMMDMTVKKTEAVMEKLGDFIVKDGDKSVRTLSHSSVRKYIHCPVSFFYEKLLGLRTDDEPVDYINALTLGNILHETILEMYLPEDKQKKLLDTSYRVEAETIKGYIDDREGLRRIISRKINKLHFALADDELDRVLPKSVQLVLPRIESMILQVLEHDLQLAPIDIEGCEFELETDWPVGKVGSVGFKFVIDRMDSVVVDGVRRRRIIDYKSGGVKLMAESVESMFGGDISEGVEDSSSTSEYTMQLMLYAALFNRWRQSLHPGAPTEDFVLAVYAPGADDDISDKKKQGLERHPIIGGRRVESSAEYAGSFESCYTHLLEEIFDQSVDFVQPSDTDNCRYCGLRDLCGR